MIKLLKKIAIINPPNSDVLSNITSGPDGASTFGLEDDVTRFTFEDNDSNLDRIDRSLSIRTLTADATNLDSYVSSQTKVYIAGVGIDGFLFIGDRQTAEGLTILGKNEQHSDNLVFDISASKRVLPGNDPATGLFESGFWVGRNGLAGYKWGDADGDGIANGWTATGMTTSFAGGVQTIGTDTTERAFVRTLFFPFPGEQLTFSIDIDAMSGDFTLRRLRVTAVDSSDVTIESQISDFTTTGRKSISLVIPANTLYVSCQVRLDANTGTVSADVKNPALRIGTETSYTPN